MKNLIISLKAHTTKLLVFAGVLALTGCTQAALDKLTSAASDAISTSLSAASNTNSYVTVSAQSVQAGSSVTAVLHAYSAANVPMHIGGLNVSFKQSGGTSTGVFSPVVDNNDGTYSTVFTASQAGTATNIVGSIANAPLLSAAPSVLVTNASASQLAFSVQPGNGVAGSALSQQPVVEIRDSFGNRVVSGPDASAMISLSLSTGSGSLNASMQAVNGVASFSGLGINLVGSNKVITASKAATSASGAMSIGSNAFAIVNGPAAKLAFSTQPGNASAGSVFGIQPVVQMQDAFGNPVVSGADAAAMINMSVDSGVLSGSLSQAGVLGQYVFSNLKIDSAGNKILTATKPATSASGILSVASNSFNNAVVLPAIPASPIGLNISSGNASIALSFSGSAGAVSYNILRGTSAGSLAQIANISSSPYNDAAVVNGTNYFYAVQAVNAGGASANSAVVQAMPLALPVISSISVNGAGSLNISASSAAGASSYAVKYSTVSGSASAGSSAACSVSGAVVSCPVSGLAGGTKYYFSVNASNATGSVNSLESSATAVGALSISSITPSTNSVSIAFSSSVGAASYDLLYGSASGVYGSTLTNIVSPVNVTGLNSGSTYYFKVRANNANGNILSNEMSSATSLPAPTWLGATLKADGSVDLSFHPVSGATSYSALRSNGSNVSVTQVAASNAYPIIFNDKPAIDGSVYTYNVQAVSALGKSGNSNTALIKPIAIPAISSVSVIGIGSLNISAPAALGADSYSLKYSTTSGSAASSANSAICSLSGAVVNCPVSSLTAGTPYYFVLNASNNIGSGVSVNSAESSGIPMGAPVLGAITPSGTSASVVFTPAAGATSHEILYGPASGMSSGQYASLLTNASSPATISGLTAGSTYFFRVKAKNASGGILLSSTEGSALIPLPSNGTIGAAPVINSVVVNGANTLDISFAPISGATSYAVKYSTTSGAAASSGSSANSACKIGASIVCTVTGLMEPLGDQYGNLDPSQRTIYYFSAIATDGSGNSKSSAEKPGIPINAFTIRAVSMTGASGNTNVYSQIGIGSQSGWQYDVLFDTVSHAKDKDGSAYPASGISLYNWFLSGLKPATAYYMRTRMRNEYGSLLSTNELAFATPAILPALSFVKTPDAVTTLTTDTISFKDAQGVASKYQCALIKSSAFSDWVYWAAASFLPGKASPGEPAMVAAPGIDPVNTARSAPYPTSMQTFLTTIDGLIANASFADCTSPAAISGLVAGNQYTFAVNGLDASGNKVASIRYSWRVVDNLWLAQAGNEQTIITNTATHKGWVPCAREGDYCQFEGTRRVLIGNTPDGIELQPWNGKLDPNDSTNPQFDKTLNGNPADHLVKSNITNGTLCSRTILGNPIGWSHPGPWFAGVACWYEDDHIPNVVPSFTITGPKIDYTKIPAAFPGTRVEAMGYGIGDPLYNNDIGAFREPCEFSHMSFDDPIVFPGQPGKAHLHVFFGNTEANAYTTTQSIMNSGSTTCDGGISNRTAYWVPAMVDTRTGTPIRPSSIMTYYKTGYLGIKPKYIHSLPPGLRMISGNAKNKTSYAADGGNPDRAVSYGCVGNIPEPDFNKLGIPFDAIKNCQVGNDLIMGIEFHQCWDGVHLDSPDHRSHMADPVVNGGVCPATHPVAIPVVTYNVHYPITEKDQAKYFQLSSDNYDITVSQDGGKTPAGAGYSGHGDYFYGWQQDPSWQKYDPWAKANLTQPMPIMDMFVTYCLNPSSDCHADLLGNDHYLLRQ